LDVIEKLKNLQKETGWSDYKIAKKAGLSAGTVSNLYKRNTVPNIFTLEAICKGFGITLSQFFAENELVEMTPDFKELAYNYGKLTNENKKLILQLTKNLR
jgi:transcriptional regulator with XRE-family HTH domain